MNKPFGYFRATAFGWEDCAESDEGAIALYEHPHHPEDKLETVMPEGYVGVPMLMTDEMANAFDPDNKISMTYLRNGWMMACAMAAKEVTS